MEKIDSTHPIDVYVGERLRLARNYRGLTQGYLGSSIDVTFQQIQKYELAASRISAGCLGWFARLLGVPVHFFYQGLPTQYHNGGPPIAPLDDTSPIDDKDVLFRRETHKLINLYYAIKDAKKRETVMDLLEVMAEKYSKVSAHQAD